MLNIQNQEMFKDRKFYELVKLGEAGTFEQLEQLNNWNNRTVEQLEHFLL